MDAEEQAKQEDSGGQVPARMAGTGSPECTPREEINLVGISGAWTCVSQSSHKLSLMSFSEKQFHVNGEENEAELEKGSSVRAQTFSRVNKWLLCGLFPRACSPPRAALARVRSSVEFPKHRDSLTKSLRGLCSRLRTEPRAPAQPTGALG